MTKEQFNEFNVVIGELRKGRRLLGPKEMNQVIELCHQLGHAVCRSCNESLQKCYDKIIDESNEFNNNN
jgi:hypothetical protein